MQRDQSIETLRGLAIVLLVMSHVIGGMDSISTGGELPMLKYIKDVLHPLRVPLFTVISGYVYTLRPVQKNLINKFIYGKTRRLLIPLVTVGTGYYILQSMVPGVNNPTNLDFSIFKIYVFTYLHLWYLHALFLVFLTIVVIEYFDFLRNFKTFLLTFFVSCILQLVLTPFLNNHPPYNSFFGLTGYLSLLPFFLFGVGLKKFENELLSIFSKWFFIIVFIFSFSVTQFSIFHLEQFTITKLVLGCSGIGLLFHFRKSYSPLATIGGYSYSIYLFHVLGAAGVRIIMESVGIEQTLLIFIASWVGGIFIPVIMEKLLEKYSYTNYLFLGRRFSIA